MSTPAESPGARLRRERERQGISLQKVADELRLDPSVIESLEADQFDRVGPAVYAKGHLKKYAMFLSLPQEPILEGYAALHTGPVAVVQQPSNLNLGAPTSRARELPQVPVAVAGVVVVLIVGLFWWSPWKHRLPPTQNGEIASATTAVVAVPPADAPAVDADEVARVPAAAPDGSMSAPAAPASAALPVAANGAPAQANAAAGTAAAQPGAGRARLRLSFSADSWVDVRDAGGRKVFVGNGRANSVKSIAGEAPLKVYLGYASGVQLEINEHAVAIARPFLSGDVARFQAGADGVLRQYAGSARPRG